MERLGWSRIDMKVQWDNCYNNWLYIGDHMLLYFMSPSSGLNSGLIESMYNCMIRQWWIISGRSAFHMHQERNGRTSGFTLSIFLLDFYCRDCRMGVIELAWSQYKIIWFESYASVIILNFLIIQYADIFCTLLHILE